MAEAPDTGLPNAPILRLGAYEGPLDLLLELARAQRVDLARVSVLALAEQFAAIVEAAIARGRVPLPVLGDWLVAAAALLALRARLLLPAEAQENRAAAREADDLRRRLAERDRLRTLAAWLEARPQLGRDVFPRGAPAAPLAGPPVADVTELLRACLRLLELPDRPRRARLVPPPLWRATDAVARLRGLLAELPAEGVPLARLLPPAGPLMRTALQRRAALASTLMAGLELEREGAVELDQPAPFAALACRLRRSPAGRAIPTDAWHAGAAAEHGEV